MCEKNQADAARQRLNFACAVEREFAFLGDRGFQVSEQAPTIVRFRKGDLIATVYHGRRSYELGFEIGHGDEHFSIESLIRVVAPAEAADYRNPVATKSSEFLKGIHRLADLVRRYGQRALEDDNEAFAELRDKRRVWSEAYALDVLAEQTRPKAEAAFREGKYREAAALYEKIAPRLGPAELKKLAVARKRM